MLGARKASLEMPTPPTPAEETKDLKLKILRRDMTVETSKRLQEKVDRTALLLFPLIFLVFNLIYWPFYLFYIQNKI